MGGVSSLTKSEKNLTASACFNDALDGTLTAPVRANGLLCLGNGAWHTRTHQPHNASSLDDLASTQLMNRWVKE